MIKQQPLTDSFIPKLKICGLTRLDQIHELVLMKVDFIGFIFYEKSPRFVLNHLCLKDISTINHQGKVGVFVNEKIGKIIEIAEEANLNYIQLHGDEDENFISDLKKNLSVETKIIKVFRIGDKTEELQSEIYKLQSEVNYLLFDTDSKAFGGTGKSFEWNLLNGINIPTPYFLSGGISEENFENITSLIQKPFALDINSKFELEPGDKDVKKIKRLIELYR